MFRKGPAKLLSLLLVATMVLGLLPITALAADGHQHGTSGFADDGSYYVCNYVEGTTVKSQTPDLCTAASPSGTAESTQNSSEPDAAADPDAETDPEPSHVCDDSCYSVTTTEGYYDCVSYPYISVTFVDPTGSNAEATARLVPDAPQYSEAAPAFTGAEDGQQLIWADVDGETVELERLTQDTTVYARWQAAIAEDAQMMTASVPRGNLIDNPYSWTDSTNGHISVYYWDGTQMAELPAGQMISMPNYVFPLFLVKMDAGYENLTANGIINPMTDLEPNILEIGKRVYGLHDVQSVYAEELFSEGVIKVNRKTNDLMLNDVIGLVPEYDDISGIHYFYRFYLAEAGNAPSDLDLSQYDGFFYWSPWLFQCQSPRTITLNASAVVLPPVDGDTSLSVSKVWAGDENPNQPNSVTVQLLNGGTVEDTQTLSAANGWGYNWRGLDADGNYTVDELNPGDNYAVSVSRQTVPTFRNAKIIRPNNEMTFAINGNFVATYHGNQYFVWTPDALTAEQKSALIESFKLAVDGAEGEGNFKNITVASTTFFSLGQSQGGMTITANENGGYTLTFADKKDRSHLATGLVGTNISAVITNTYTADENPGEGETVKLRVEHHMSNAGTTYSHMTNLDEEITRSREDMGKGPDFLAEGIKLSMAETIGKGPDSAYGYLYKRAELVDNTLRLYYKVVRFYVSTSRIAAGNQGAAFTGSIPGLIQNITPVKDDRDDSSEKRAQYQGKYNAITENVNDYVASVDDVALAAALQSAQVSYDPANQHILWYTVHEGNFIHVDGIVVNNDPVVTYYPNYTPYMGDKTSHSEKLSIGINDTLAQHSVLNYAATGLSVNGNAKFLGWSEKPEGPVNYQPNESISVARSASLYAQWEFSTYSVVYHAAEGYTLNKTNGSDGTFTVKNRVGDRITSFGVWLKGFPEPRVTMSMLKTAEGYLKYQNGVLSNAVSFTEGMVVSGLSGSNATPFYEAANGAKLGFTHFANGSELHILVSPVDYTVTYQSGEHGSFANEAHGNLAYMSNTPVFADGKNPVSKDAGYVFTGWKTATGEARSEKVVRDAVYIAQWEKTSEFDYTVEYFYQKSDGTYAETTADVAHRAGTAYGQTVAIVDSDKLPKSQAGVTYVLDANKADGWKSTVGGAPLKVYFKLQLSVTYLPGDYGNFAQQAYSGLDHGAATPAFQGQTPANGSYVFSGWNPVVAETVTADAVYVAQWTYVGGGYNPNPGPGTGGTTVISDEETPLAPGTDEIIDIVDEDVPLTEQPVEEGPIIMDEKVPLGDLPMTGEPASQCDPTTTLGFLALLAAMTAVGLAFLLYRKSKEEEA